MGWLGSHDTATARASHAAGARPAAGRSDCAHGGPARRPRRAGRRARGPPRGERTEHHEHCKAACGRARTGVHTPASCNRFLSHRGSNRLSWGGGVVPRDNGPRHAQRPAANAQYGHGRAVAGKSKRGASSRQLLGRLTSAAGDMARRLLTSAPTSVALSTRSVLQRRRPFAALERVCSFAPAQSCLQVGLLGLLR